jgi:hypothetical protein
MWIKQFISSICHRPTLDNMITDYESESLEVVCTVSSDMSY